MKSSGKHISKQAIQKMIHYDRQPLVNDLQIATFIDQTIMDQTKNKKQIIRETIEYLKNNGQEISIVAITKEIGLSKKFIRLEETIKLIDEESEKHTDEKRLQIFDVIQLLKSK